LIKAFGTNWLLSSPFFFLLYRSTPLHSDCLQRKKSVLEQLESKLETGIDRSLTAIVGHIKVTLQTEQKKSDFKPETDDAILNIASPVSHNRQK